MPGVLAVYTAQNLPLDPVQGFVMLPPVFSRPPLATDRVRFVGDVVAAVVAETRAEAVDAAEYVVVDYDPLPVVIDAEAALAEGAPLLFEEHGSNLAIAFEFGEDPDLLADAEVVVSAAHREPARRRGADGAQRDRGHPRRRRPHLLRADPGCARRAARDRRGRRARRRSRCA